MSNKDISYAFKEKGKTYYSATRLRERYLQEKGHASIPLFNMNMDMQQQMGNDLVK